MKEIILLKEGEIALKGLNKRTFEESFIKNLRHRLKPLGKFDYTRSQSMIYCEPLEDTIDMDEAVLRASRVFGAAAICRAMITEKDFETICRDALEYCGEELSCARTFKVQAKRSDKRFPMKSPEICAELGGRILEKFPKLDVDVKNPDVTVNVEIRDTNAYIHTGNRPAAGGIPVGTSGRAMLLLSGGIDSPVAGYMVAKRGVQIEATYFHAPPYTSERAKQKVIDLAKIVSKYSGPITLNVVNFTDIQMAIYEKCPHDELTIIMRRYMMKIAEDLGKASGCQGLVTGESIGQVASQTMASLYCTNEVCTMPVFRPVIGFDKQEIIDISEKIGSYETSIQPFEDCCTIFVAKHPVTKPNLNVIKQHETNLDGVIEELYKTAIETTEKIVIE